MKHTSRTYFRVESITNYGPRVFVYIMDGDEIGFAENDFTDNRINSKYKSYGYQ